MNTIERIKELLKAEGISRDHLAEITKIPYSRWQNVITEKTKLRAEEVEALGAAFPEYKHWIAFGEELPEAGQISPATKQVMNANQIQKAAE